MSTKNIFERATKLKLRFEVGKGSVSVESLWDLSLQSLNELIVPIYKKLQEGEISFIAETSSANRILQLKFDILKHIIDDRRERQERAKLRNEKNATITQIENLLADKKQEEMKGKSTAELFKMLAELKGGDEVEED